MGIEIEKKFLVTRMPEGLSEGVEICQGYLINTPDRVVRVRIKGDAGFLAIKGSTGQASVRQEFEYTIPVADARQMLDRFCEKPFVEKCRHTHYHQGMKWEIDRFSGANQGLVVAEIELSSPDQTFALPAWAGPEVTNDPRYLNSALVRHPYTTWPPVYPGL
jgi:adenylate cyclase